MPENCRVHASIFDGEVLTTRISEMLMPGQARSLTVQLDVPGEPGDFVAEIAVERAGVEFERTRIPLQVRNADSSEPAEPILEELVRKLSQADSLVELPDGYTDVSEGRLASLKRTIKRKLLHQFQTAYVDVLSRQQSAMNRMLLDAMQELADCLAMLGQAGAVAVEQFARRLREIGAAVEVADSPNGGPPRRHGGSTRAAGSPRVESSRNVIFL